MFQYVPICSNMFQYVPLVRRMPANACQHPAEHVNVLYERGGSYTSVQLCISGTGGRAHPRESRTVLIGSYRFQVVPICSNSIQS